MESNKKEQSYPQNQWIGKQVKEGEVRRDAMERLVQRNQRESVRGKAQAKAGPPTLND